MRNYDWTKHPKQREFIWSRKRFKAWKGGRGSTKTSSAVFSIMKDVQGLYTAEGNPPDDIAEVMQDPTRFAGAKIIVAAPIAKQLKGGPLEKFDEFFDDTGLVEEKINGNDPRRELVNGIRVFGYNVGPSGEGAEAWRGMEAAIFWPDETAQMPVKAFNLGNATLRQRKPNGEPYEYQTIITTTPRGQNWLDHRLFNPETRATYVDADDNPIYTDDRLLMTHSSSHVSVEAGFITNQYLIDLGYKPGSLMWRQEVDGEVVSWSGLVFDCFKAEQHMPQPFIPPQMEVVYGGVDFGTVDPTCILIVGLDNQNRMWVLKEYYQPRAQLSDVMELLGKWSAEYHVRQWNADSDILVKMMQRAGLRAKTPYKAKDAADVSITFLNQMFARDMLFISPECRALKMELETYEYKELQDGSDKGETTFLAKVKPNQPDHALDCLRYACLPLSNAKAMASYGKSVDFAFGAASR